MLTRDLATSSTEVPCGQVHIHAPGSTTMPRFSLIILAYSFIHLCKCLLHYYTEHVSYIPSSKVSQCANTFTPQSSSTCISASIQECTYVALHGIYIYSYMYIWLKRWMIERQVVTYKWHIHDDGGGFVYIIQNWWLTSFSKSSPLSIIIINYSTALRDGNTQCKVFKSERCGWSCQSDGETCSCRRVGAWGAGRAACQRRLASRRQNQLALPAASLSLLANKNEVYTQTPLSIPDTRGDDLGMSVYRAPPTGPLSPLARSHR